MFVAGTGLEQVERANLFLREACPHCGAEPDTTVIDPTGEHSVCAACADQHWPNATVYNQEAS